MRNGSLRALVPAALFTIALATRPAVPAPPPDASAAPSVAQSAPAASQAPAKLDAGPIVQAIDKLATDIKGFGGSASVMIVDLETGETIASRAEHAPMNPASNAKLVTAAAALKLLGSNHRYLTGLYGKLDGDRVPNLVLRGTGDPSLEAGHLYDMARELVTAGVRRVGDILVDQSYFDDRFVPPAFEEQPDEWAPFRAPVSAVAIDENTVTLSIRPAAKGKDATIRVDPPGVVEIVGSVRTTQKSDPEKLTLDLSAKGERLIARVGGHVPEGARVVRVRRRLEDPRLAPGHVLRAILKSAGLEVDGDVKLGGAKEKRLLASHRSASLGELLGSLGKESDNFYAEMIFKTIAAEKKGKTASFEASADLVTTFLKDASAFEEGVVVKNGSGLFDANRTTAWATTSLLRAAYRDSSIGPEYLAQLASGGIDGTLRSRFRGLSERGVVRAKTGTLKSVASLSGYVLAPAPRAPVAFSIFTNGIPDKVSAARPLIDKVVESLARALWKPR